MHTYVHKNKIRVSHEFFFRNNFSYILRNNLYYNFAQHLIIYQIILTFEIGPFSRDFNFSGVNFERQLLKA